MLSLTFQLPNNNPDASLCMLLNVMLCIVSAAHMLLWPQTDSCVQQCLGMVQQQQQTLLSLQEAISARDVWQVIKQLQQLRTEAHAMGNAALASAVDTIAGLLTAVGNISRTSASPSMAAVSMPRYKLLSAVSLAFTSWTDDRKGIAAMPVLLGVLQAVQGMLISTNSTAEPAAVRDLAMRFNCMQLLTSLMKLYMHPEKLSQPCAVARPLENDPTGVLPNSNFVYGYACK